MIAAFFICLALAFLAAIVAGVRAELRNRKVVCPRCGKAGGLRPAKTTKVKNGFSTGKVTAAVLTGGVSVLATGLASTEKVTAAPYCVWCNLAAQKKLYTDAYQRLEAADAAAQAEKENGA
jgi:hypothetical protein